jgi:hypothetical protein
MKEVNSLTDLLVLGRNQRADLPSGRLKRLIGRVGIFF